MIKSIFWVAITTLVLILLCIGLGIYEAFILNLWFGVVLSSCLVIMMTVLVLLVIKFVNDIRQWFISVVNKLPKWLRKLLGI